jgi:co-chaperonin GroES (HSP10)
MKTPNFIWIKYPKQLENTIQHGSLILDFVPHYKPEWHSILKGEAHSIPEKNDLGIVDILIPGDTIYFHYLSADEENMHKEDGVNYLRIPMHKIFCYVRDGKIIPYGGHVLAKSVFDEDVEEVEVDGKKIPAKLSKSGLVTSLDVSFRENLSKVCYIGQPLEWDEPLEVVPGDIVIMEQLSHHKNIIENIEYFVFSQSDILAILQ